jgi:UDP:flavonoid glycosyltransferase YjiC (YdhE family)
MARILIATFGSFGDLHPYIAIGLELWARGHSVTIATSPLYKAKVEAEGLGFHGVRPEISLDDREKLAFFLDRRHGSERVVRAFASVVRETYEDTIGAAAGADAIITHPLAFAAVLAAQKLHKLWISSVLAPISFLSAYDPPVVAPAPWLVSLRRLGPAVMKAVWDLGRRTSISWMAPVLELRQELGLGPTANPLFEGAHSPALALALFSRHLAQPQPDWPVQTIVTGFPFYDRHHESAALPPEVEAFFAAGPAPVVFTLGSSAVATAGGFYRDGLHAVERLGARAVFLTGSHPQGLPERLPENVITLNYAPHSEVLPRAAATVHPGGIGTTAQAVRAGRPMLVVPFAHDQYDNAERVRRTGAAEVLHRPRYNARRAESYLMRLLKDSSYAQAAESLGKRVTAESGAASAAGAVERCLH